MGVFTRQRLRIPAHVVAKEFLQGGQRIGIHRGAASLQLCLRALGEDHLSVDVSVIQVIFEIVARVACDQAAGDEIFQRPEVCVAERFGGVFPAFGRIAAVQISPAAGGVRAADSDLYGFSVGAGR